MNTVTVPYNNLAKIGDLVLIPKTEYEEFLRIRKLIRVVKLTSAERRSLEYADKEIKNRQYKPWSQLKYELAGFSN